MSLYISLRFKGIVKKEFRDNFEKIAMYGKWDESDDKILKTFGQDRSARFIPCAYSIMVDRWNDEPFETSYNKDTGEWIFQADINIHSFPWNEWIEEIIPYCMEYISHFETSYESWGSDYKTTCLEEFNDGKFNLLGWIDENGKILPKDYFINI